MSRVPVDGYVFQTLMRDLVGHDRRPAAYLLYLYLWSRGAARRGGGVPMSLSELAGETGMSKSAVQAGLRHLRNRRLLRSEREHATARPMHALLKPWIRR